MSMAKVCNMRCVECRHADCINDDPPSMREISIIEADDRYVRWSRLTAEQKQQREIWKQYRKKYDAAHKQQRLEKRRAEKQQRAAREKAWRERRRSGVNCV